MKKLNVLIRGWDLHHSYGLVNCFQIIHFVKYFQNEISITMEDAPFYRNHWQKQNGIFPEEYEKILQNIKKYNPKDNDENFDVIYNITFPYVVMFDDKFKNIPKCVFYTSEFSLLDKTYFENTNEMSEEQVLNLIKNDTSLFFSTPSRWSYKGMEKYIQDIDNRLFTITHGVDTSIYRHDISKRANLRAKYNIKDNDIVLLNIGSMTGNKGIHLILIALYNITNLHSKNWKLLLKATGDLYECRKYVLESIKSIKNIIETKEQLETFNKFIDEHVIFLSATMSCMLLNDLYNACDLYISPYSAEGFNLTCLEALSSGLPVLVPQTGSTNDYIDKIIQNCNAKGMIYKCPSSIIRSDDGKCFNEIQVVDLINTCLKFQNTKKDTDAIKSIYKYIESDLSWKFVCGKLLEMFYKIIYNDERK